MTKRPPPTADDYYAWLSAIQDMKICYPATPVKKEEIRRIEHDLENRWRDALNEETK